MSSFSSDEKKTNYEQMADYTLIKTAARGQVPVSTEKQQKKIIEHSCT